MANGRGDSDSTDGARGSAVSPQPPTNANTTNAGTTFNLTTLQNDRALYPIGARAPIGALWHGVSW